MIIPESSDSGFLLLTYWLVGLAAVLEKSFRQRELFGRIDADAFPRINADGGDGLAVSYGDRDEVRQVEFVCDVILGEAGKVLPQPRRAEAKKRWIDLANGQLLRRSVSFFNDVRNVRVMLIANNAPKIIKRRAPFVKVGNGNSHERERSCTFSMESDQACNGWRAQGGVVGVQHHDSFNIVTDRTAGAGDRVPGTELFVLHDVVVAGAQRFAYLLRFMTNDDERTRINMRIGDGAEKMRYHGLAANGCEGFGKPVVHTRALACGEYNDARLCLHTVRI